MDTDGVPEQERRPLWDAAFVWRHKHASDEAIGIHIVPEEPRVTLV